MLFHFRRLLELRFLSLIEKRTHCIGTCFYSFCLAIWQLIFRFLLQVGSYYYRNFLEKIETNEVESLVLKLLNFKILGVTLLC